MSAPLPHAAACRWRVAALALAAAACSSSATPTGRITEVPVGTTTTGDIGSTYSPTAGTGTTTGATTGTTTSGGTIGLGTPVQIGGAPTFGTAPGMSLMAADGSACLLSTGTGVTLATCDGTTAQRWELLGGTLQSLSGSGCLTAQPSDGAGVAIAACNGSDPTQQFTVTLGHVFAATTTGDASLCLANANGGTVVTLAACTQGNQGTPYILGWDGVQLMLGNNTTQCLRGATTGVGVTTCSDTDGGQMWTLYTDGQLMLQSLQLCLDVKNGTVAEGAALAIAACTDSTTQQWSWSGLDSTLRPRSNPGLYLAQKTSLTGTVSVVLTAATQQAWTVNK